MMQMTVRFLRTTEPTNVMIFYLMLCTLVYSIIGCAATHKQLIVPTNRWEIMLLIGQGLFGFGNQVCITKGLANARAASVMCMQYFSIVISQLAGMLLFREFTSWIGDAGMVLIVLSMVVYMKLETGRKQRR
jgi:drug/metabolite transporter (DMT)-like permease